MKKLSVRKSKNTLVTETNEKTSVMSVELGLPETNSPELILDREVLAGISHRNLLNCHNEQLLEATAPEIKKQGRSLGVEACKESLTVSEKGEISTFKYIERNDNTNVIRSDD